MIDRTDFLEVLEGPRATSTKTRIETTDTTSNYLGPLLSEGDFHENKD